MKISIQYFLLLTIFSAISIQSGCKDDYGRNDKVIESGQSLLWRIDGNNLSAPSYLFGTMHIIPQKDFHLGDHLKQIVSNSNLVIFEIKIDLASQLVATKGAMLPSGKSLQDILSVEDYSKLKAFLLDTIGISKFQFLTFQQMKPILVSQVFATESMGEQPASYELSFQKIAQENKISISGLETAMQQISFFDSIPMDDQIKMMMKGIDNYRSDVKVLDKMVLYYKNQWIDSLLVIMEEDESDLMDYEGLLLTNRNHVWIPKIEEFIANGKVFIAVGAAHLPGPNGVIALLKEKGYTLTPVSVD